MQPEPTEVSTEASSTQVLPVQNTYIQHGFRDINEPGARPPPGEERVEPRESVADADTAVLSTANLDKTVETPSSWMKTTSAQRTQSPVDRIAEHERALTTSPKKSNEGLRFKVVERNKNPRDENSSIAAFPNGRHGRDLHPIGRASILIQIQRS